MKDAILSKVAEGLFASAKENKVISIYREDLKFFSWNLKTNPEYFSFLRSPFIDYKDKCESLNDLFGNAFLPEILEFIKILINRELIGDIERIRKIFNRLADKEVNVIEGKIYTPFDLTDEQIHKICNAFSKKLNQEVILKQRKDESLIAGIKVLLGGTVYEYSINSELDNLRIKLTSSILTKEEQDHEWYEEFKYFISNYKRWNK